MRTLVVVSIAVMLVSAIALYAINTDTRQLEAEVARQEDALERARQDIAVMKAETAHLARPERIAPHALAIGLRPADPRQFADPARIAPARGEAAGR